MNKLTTEKLMTIKEVAEIFGVDEITIRRKVKELFPELLQHGKTTYLNEIQVTSLKINSDKNVGLPKTQLEKELIIQQALQFQQEKINSMQELIKEQETKLIKQQPKVDIYDDFIEAWNYADMAETAKILNLGYGRNILFRKLREMKILDSNNVPYQKYITAEYFKVKIKPNQHTGRNDYVTFATPNGIEWLRSKL